MRPCSLGCSLRNQSVSFPLIFISTTSTSDFEYYFLLAFIFTTISIMNVELMVMMFFMTVMMILDEKRRTVMMLVMMTVMMILKGKRTTVMMLATSACQLLEANPASPAQDVSDAPPRCSTVRMHKQSLCIPILSTCEM